MYEHRSEPLLSRAKFTTAKTTAVLGGQAGMPVLPVIGFSRASQLVGQTFLSDHKGQWWFSADRQECLSYP
jgi:hypothetical protein